MTSDEAWKDFKSGYKDFEEPVEKAVEPTKTSIDAKLDVIMQQQNEIAVDTSRVADTLPQIQAEEQPEEPVEESFEEEQTVDEVPTEELGEEVPNEEPNEELNDEEEPVDEEQADEETVDEEPTEEEQAEEEPVDEVSDEEKDNAEDEMGNPFASINGDDEKDKDEVLEKAVNAILALNERVNALEKSLTEQAEAYNELKKSITVQQQESAVKKQAPAKRPAQVRKSVGAVSRPPTAVGYTANGMHGTNTSNAPTLGTASPKDVVNYYKTNALM